MARNPYVKGLETDRIIIENWIEAARQDPRPEAMAQALDMLALAVAGLQVAGCLHELEVCRIALARMAMATEIGESNCSGR